MNNQRAFRKSSGLPRQGILSRRVILAGTASVVLLPAPASANPVVGRFLWAVGKFVAATAIQWAISKALDHFWEDDPDKIKGHIASEPHPATTPTGSSGEVHGRFKDEVLQAKPDGGEFATVNPIFVRAMDALEVSPRVVFRKWGAPSSPTELRSASDGVVGGQWFSQHRRRFVVYRKFGDSVLFLPCVGDYADDAYAATVKGAVSRAGPRLRVLIENPRDYRFKDEDRPENDGT